MSPSAVPVRLADFPIRLFLPDAVVADERCVGAVVAALNNPDLRRRLAALVRYEPEYRPVSAGAVTVAVMASGYPTWSRGLLRSNRRAVKSRAHRVFGALAQAQLSCYSSLGYDAPNPRAIWRNGAAFVAGRLRLKHGILPLSVGRMGGGALRRRMQPPAEVPTLSAAGLADGSACR